MGSKPTRVTMAKRVKDTRPDVSRALNALRRMVRGLRAAAENVEREFKISAAQLFVMRELAELPEQSVKDLATVTMTTHSTVSQVVGQLIAKGFVTRATDSADGRRSVLRLTRQGATLLKKAPRAIQSELIDGFATLRPSEQRALATGLEKWLTASGLGGVAVTMLFDKPPPPRKQREKSGTAA
ncbi:MAG TPA: MarR family transcriptional regulator [Gemmatimonadaceae bacterium]